MNKLTFALLSFSALVPAIMLHEVAHGAAALWCGDRTAKEAGRLSLNPLRHVDPFMSVILPALLALSGSRVLFGGAKPVPIDLRRCRDPMKAYWITAIAGPLCNLAQAVLITCYELFAASGRYVPPHEKAPPAPQAQKAQLNKNWAAMLREIGFMKEEQSDHFMQGFQRVFSRGVVTNDDAALMLGVARQAVWAAKNHA